MLLHGIMSSIAEFYSKNLAHESRKGMLQKVQAGGTPGKPRRSATSTPRTRTAEGREVRTVEVDRSGNARPLGCSGLCQRRVDDEPKPDELEERGVMALPRPKYPARPLAISRSSCSPKEPLLPRRSRVRGRPVSRSAPGDRRGRVVAAGASGSQGRAQSGEKPRVHPHYLKGSVYCGDAGEALGIEVVRNRQGRRYDYFDPHGPAEATQRLPAPRPPS